MMEVDEPLVTFALFSYEQEKFIKEAVEAAFAQDYKNLEIILSDDCSRDETYEIIVEIAKKYKGTAKVILNRNEKNLGLAGHFNRVMRISNGDIIVVAAGDDISLPDRVSRTVSLFRKYKEVVLISFNDHQIDASGVPTKINSCKDISKSSFVSSNDLFSQNAARLSGASRGFRRILFTQFGELHDECPTEDTPYLLRALLIGKGYSCCLPGIYYRRHGNNLSADHNINAMNFSAISSQYWKDLKTAKETGSVSLAQFNDAARWIERDSRRRLLRKRIYDKEALLLEYFRQVLFSTDFTLKEKLSFFKKIIIRHPWLDLF